MISIGKVGNAGYSKHVQDNTAEGAAEYYSGEDIPSQWSGSLAAQQGRSGEVEKGELIETLRGKISDASGERILSEERSNWTAGYDLTVSAPKSVSVEALVHGNDAALEAHRDAVAEVLDRFESGVGARVTQGGKTEHEQTGNAQIASFEHHMSASGDPHLHTHNVVSNATICEDGRARAIDAKESIYGQVGDLNKTYNDALERGLQERGIATYRDDKGQPQIEGYDREGMRAFSERQSAMDAALKERGANYDSAGQQERELARQETRKDIDRAEIKSRDDAVSGWQKTAEAARDAGAHVGPGERVSDAGNSGRGDMGKGEKSEQSQGYSREEFREAKWAINEGKAAEQRLESGNYRSEEHKAQLEQRVEQMEQLRSERPDLYERAERSVEKMGVRDPDKKIDEAAMNRAYEAAQNATEHVRESESAKREQEAGRSGAGSAGSGLQSAADAVADELRKDLTTEAEREKAREQARERDRIEAEKARIEERRVEADARQEKVDAAGKQMGGEVKTAHERAGEQAEKSDREKQESRDSAGQDNYARARAERLIEERREAQADRTQTAAGGKKENEAEPRRPEIDELKSMREEVEKLAESLIRRSGYDENVQSKAMNMNAEKATAEQIAEFVEKYGSVKQKEQMEALKERLSQANESDARDKLADEEKARNEKMKSRDEPGAVNTF